MARSDTLKVAVAIAFAVVLVMAFSAVMASPRASRINVELCEARAEAAARRIAERKHAEGGPIVRAVSAPSHAIARLFSFDDPCASPLSS